MVKTHPLENKPDPVPAIVPAFCVATILSILLWTLLHTIAPPIGWNSNVDAPVSISALAVVVLCHEIWLNAPAIHTLLDLIEFIPYLLFSPLVRLASLGIFLKCGIYFVVSILAGRVCYRIVFDALYRGLPPVRRVKTLVGHTPLFDRLGAAHIKEKWRDRLFEVGRGIFLAPGVAMPRDVEAEHLAVMGTTGAGKSTILEGILKQGIRRGDRGLIIDVKGDLKRRFDIDSAGVISLGSEGDIWAIGHDIRTRQNATELAAVLIAASREPMWSDGARLYLVGLIVALQRRHGRKWKWGDLKDALAKPFEEQEALIREAMPDVVQLLQVRDGEPTATVMSLLVTVVANVGSIAWVLSEREKAGGRCVSMRAWAAGKSKLKVVILRLEFDRETQSTALLKLALRCVQATLLGNEVPDGVDHAIWVGLDELPRFCDDQTVERLVALGRSRGIRITAALQVPAQLRKSLGADTTDALLGNFGLQIVSRVAPGPSRVEIARNWFGSRTVTWDPALIGGKSDEKWPEKDIPVLSEAELTGILGKFYSGRGQPFIRAAITGFEDIPILSWSVGWADKL